jgi:hypothetical protein
MFQIIIPCDKKLGTKVLTMQPWHRYLTFFSLYDLDIDIWVSFMYLTLIFEVFLIYVTLTLVFDFLLSIWPWHQYLTFFSLCDIDIGMILYCHNGHLPFQPLISSGTTHQVLEIFAHSFFWHVTWWNSFLYQSNVNFLFILAFVHRGY